MAASYRLSDGYFGSLLGNNPSDYMGMHGALHQLLMEHGRRFNGFDNPVMRITTE